MKSNAVNLAAGVFANGADSLSTATKSAEENTVFASFMERAGRSQEMSPQNEKDAAGTSVTDKVSDSTEKTPEIKNEKIQTTDENHSDKAVENEPEDNVRLPEEDTVTEEEKAVLSGLMENIAALFMEKFEITPEEFTGLMESMGIEAADLLDPAVLTDMVKTLSGAEDSMALLTNEELYTDCMEILEDVSALQKDVLDELGISAGELEKLLENSRNLMQNADAVVNENNEQPDAALAETTADILPEETVKTEEDVTYAKEKKNLGDDGGISGTAEENDGSMLIEKDVQKTSEKETRHQEAGNGQNLNSGDFVSQLKSNVDMDLQTAGTQFLASETDYESIIRQISEQIRIHVSENASSMEMQLNPGTLGKVEMHLTLKQGALTAQFTVENEQVKEAMESQIVQLREDFERQGLKVEAVEVTVESHEFEQNLMQGEERNEQAWQEQTASNRRLRFGLDALAEETDFLSDEELAEKIMKEDGTTLNYRV